MALQRGDHGEVVKGLQRGLNKLVSLLLVDGDFGPGTEAAVVDARAVLGLEPSKRADAALQGALEALPDCYPSLTAAGVGFIAREEVGGPAAYRRRFQHPVWPSPESGITIGIGYDLHFVDPPQFQADWGDQLPGHAVARLAETCARRGSPELLTSVDDIEVPLRAAVNVFVARVLPRYEARARGVYPQIEALPPARRTALVSLVYNRGVALSGERRREMRRIAELLAAGDTEAVADQFESMVRLWPELPGLVARREREARLWRSGFAAVQLD